jgi:acetyltransferase-like isoleucine patch superfamily enzyme
MFSGGGAPVASKPVLMVGTLAGDAEEVYETAILLGYDPMFLVFPGQSPPRLGPWYNIHDTPDELRHFPATVARAPQWPDLVDLRIDAHWRTRLERQVATAIQQGLTRWPALVHPTAAVSASAALGRGVFVGPLTSVSSLAEVGEFSRLARGTHIGHHVSIGAYCHFGPGVIVPSGVVIGRGCTVGPGAVFINDVVVEDNCLIAAGSLVTKSVSAGSFVLGNPGKARLS